MRKGLSLITCAVGLSGALAGAMGPPRIAWASPAPDDDCSGVFYDDGGYGWLNRGYGHYKPDPELEKRLAEERAKREKEEQERKVKQIALIRGDLSQPGPKARVLFDGIAHQWVKSLASDHSASLLLGNPYRAPTPEEAAQYAELVGRVSKKALVIYDADSAASQIISDAAGDMGIGISGDPLRKFSRNAKHVVLIQNPYLRLSAFASARRTAMSPDSLTGLGLAFNKDMKIIFDPSLNKWKQGLVEFERDLKLPEINLGFTYSSMSAPDVHGMDRSVERLTDFYSPLRGRPSLSFDPAQAVEAISSDSINRIYEDAQAMMPALAEIRALPGGAVVFGAARYESRYADLAYSSIYALGRRGITIATGGSSGFMEIANAAAFNAGANSIGIPRSGLKTETRVAGEAQTLTIQTRDYETRIPLLLDRRQMFIMAPGGSGTMKEIAAALVYLSANSGARQRLVFLSAGYYGGLYKWLTEGTFPAEFAQRVVLVDSPEEMEAVATQVESHLGPRLTTNLLRTPEAPKKRNDIIKFEKKPIYVGKGDDDDYSGD